MISLSPDRVCWSIVIKGERFSNGEKRTNLLPRNAGIKETICKLALGVTHTELRFRSEGKRKHEVIVYEDPTRQRESPRQTLWIMEQSRVGKIIGVSFRFDSTRFLRPLVRQLSVPNLDPISRGGGGPEFVPYHVHGESTPPYCNVIRATCIFTKQEKKRLPGSCLVTQVDRRNSKSGTLRRYTTRNSLFTMQIAENRKWRDAARST